MSKKKDITNEFLGNWINNSIKLSEDSIFDRKLLADLLEYKPSKNEPEVLTRTVLIEKVSKIQNSIWEYTEKHLNETNLFESTFYALYAMSLSRDKF